MTQRKTIAVAVLTLWAGSLGVMAYKELLPNEDKRRAAMVLLIEPITHYYAVERAGNHLGYASSQVDTSIFGVRLRHIVITQKPGGADSNRAALQFSAQLSPQLRLRDFEVLTGHLPNRQVLIARSLGDTALELRHRTGSRAPADTVPYNRNAVTPEVAPFVLALGRELRTDDVYELDVFDRASNQVTRASIRIEAESLFVLPDSAARNPATGRWESARLDTVLAWRATLPGEGGGTIWFDRSGRTVMQDLGGGITMLRTAFELAFENWRATRDLAAEREIGVTPPPRY